MKRRTVKVGQVIVVSLMLLVWLSISNHCALGALVAAATQSAMAPMHCHGNPPSPVKKSGGEEMPCCKVLRATIANPGKLIEVSSKDFHPIQGWVVADLVSAREVQLHRAPEELDTGPPFAGSFAESVLQRSLLAHAPPSLS